MRCLLATCIAGLAPLRLRLVGASVKRNSAGDAGDALGALLAIWLRFQTFKQAFHHRIDWAMGRPRYLGEYHVVDAIPAMGHCIYDIRHTPNS